MKSLGERRERKSEPRRNAIKAMTRTLGRVNVWGATNFMLDITAAPSSVGTLSLLAFEDGVAAGSEVRRVSHRLDIDRGPFEGQ